MFKVKTLFFWLFFCRLDGVFAGRDAVKSVSVMEGDSVSLNSSLTEIQEDEEIFWRFGTNGPRIAKTDGVKYRIYDVPDGRFRDRLKLDKKTGSLSIMNIRTEDAGVYEVEISNSRSSSTYRFTVTVYGVFAGTDAVKSVSVTEGDSVSLNSSLTEIQEDEEIIWTFGTNGPLIAKTDGVKYTIPDVLDGRFRDRLKLDKKTGSLTIMNIRTEHAGVYAVKISGRKSSSKHRFTVTVYGVFAGTDAVKSVSVMEGDSVSLNSSVTEIQEDEEIFWTFGTNGHLVAKTDGVKYRIYDVSDGRFRDRLKLDRKTGSLTIMNIRTEDAGVYEVQIISSRSETKHRFTVTVYDLTSLTRRTAAAAEATPISAVATNRSTASTE